MPARFGANRRDSSALRGTLFGIPDHVAGSPDEHDLKPGLESGEGAAALSFVRPADDIERLPDPIERHSNAFLHMIAKRNPTRFPMVPMTDRWCQSPRDL